MTKRKQDAVEASNKRLRGNSYEQYQHTDADVLADITRQYRNNIKLTINGLTHADTFQRYVSANTPVQPALVGPVTQSICHDDASRPAYTNLNLADPANQMRVQTAVTNAIRPLTAATFNELDKIKKEISALDTLLKAPDRKFSNEDIAANLETKRAKGEAAIKAQHAEEVQKLTTYFDNHAHPNHPQGLTAAQLTALKTETLASLKTEQTKQIDDFNADINKSVTTLNNMRVNYYNTEALESQRQFGDKTMRDAINLRASQGQPVVMGSDGHNISIEGLKLSDIKVNNQRLLHCFSGRNVRITKNAKGEESGFEFELNRWLGLATVSDLYKGTKATKALTGEFTNVAQALKAEGFENITCKSDHPDEETAKLIARCQYEAALRAGFDKDKVKLKVNGKDVSPESIFSASQLKRVHDNYDKKVANDKAVLGPQKAKDSTAEQAAINKAVQTIVEGREPGVAPDAGLRPA